MTTSPSAPAVSVNTSLSSPPPVYLEILSALQKAQSVFITAHVGPDGDTLGSMLALKHALKEQRPDLRVDCVIAGKMPDIYHFMPGIDTVINVETQPERLLSQYDVGVSVDCGTLGRLGPAKPYFEGAKMAINIDHHVSNQRFGQLNLVEVNASSSGQVVGQLLDAWNWPISQATAICIYVTLLTDTGGFRFACTTAEVFDWAARLVRLGAEPEPIFKTVYENRPMAQAKLFAQTVLDHQMDAHSAKAGQLIWYAVSQAQLKQLGALEEHTEGMIDRLRELEGVKIAALFKETTEGTTKVSLRSNVHGINVSAILEPLGGGGHVMAAGIGLNMSLKEAQALLLPKLEAALG